MIFTFLPVWCRWLPTYCPISYAVWTLFARPHRSSHLWDVMCRYGWCICFGEEVPFLALLAISALDSKLVLEDAGDVTPLWYFASFEDVLEEFVLLLCPWPFVSHTIRSSYTKPIIANHTLPTYTQDYISLKTSENNSFRLSTKKPSFWDS